MQALILAGGLGTRLRPLTHEVPKPMVPVHGKPFLAHQLEMLCGCGIREVVLSVGYLAEKIIEHFGDGWSTGMKIRYSFEDTPMGTGGGVRAAASLLGDAFFVIYGDSYLPIDYSLVERRFRDSGRQGLLVAYDNTFGDTTVPSNLSVDGESFVTRYDKGSPGADLDLVEAGVLAFRKSVIDLIPQGRSSLESEVFPLLIRARELVGFVTRQRFYDIGTPERVKGFERYLDDNIENTV